jgi:hypothetical protein
MSAPSSFCTVSTKKCKNELVSLLSSILYHHSDITVYIVCDTDTYKSIEPLFRDRLKIIWHNDLDKYSNLSRQQMTEKGIWSDFQMSKADAIQYALQEHTDTLFLDADIILLEPMKDIDATKQLGVSRGFINKETSDQVGIYNGGFLWTNQPTLPEKWRNYTKTSRYFDQASIEDLVKEYSYFEFPEQHNVQSWRFIVGEESFIERFFKPTTRHILYKDKRLQSIHTHFNEMRFQQINHFLLQQLHQARMFHVIQWISN